jgi:hypothetical protein
VLAAGEAPDEDLEKGGRSPCRRRLAASKERARMGGGTPKKDSGGKEREDATALGSILGRKAREAFSFLFLSSHCNGKLFYNFNSDCYYACDLSLFFLIVRSVNFLQKLEDYWRRYNLYVRQRPLLHGS